MILGLDGDLHRVCDISYIHNSQNCFSDIGTFCWSERGVYDRWAQVETCESVFNVSILVRIVTIIVYLSFAFLFSWEISLMAVCSIIIIYFLFQPITKTIKRLSRISVKTNTRLQNSFIQLIFYSHLMISRGCQECQG